MTFGIRDGLQVRSTCCRCARSKRVVYKGAELFIPIYVPEEMSAFMHNYLVTSPHEVYSKDWCIERNHRGQNEALCDDKCWSEACGRSAKLIRPETEGRSVGHHANVVAIIRRQIVGARL